MLTDIFPTLNLWRMPCLDEAALNRLALSTKHARKSPSVPCAAYHRSRTPQLASQTIVPYLPIPITQKNRKVSCGIRNNEAGGGRGNKESEKRQHNSNDLL